MNRDTPRIVLHNDDTSEMAEVLRQAAPTVEVYELNSYEGAETFIEDVKPDIIYSVRFGGTYGFPVDAFLSDNGPEWISVGGSGCDHLGIWDTSKVTVTNSAGVAADMMAEYAFGCFLHFTLGIPGLQSDKAARRWDPRNVQPLKGKTLLIVGLGQTGQSVAARAKAFGMRVIGTRARPEPMPNVDEVHKADALPDLWPTADMIVVAVPLLPTTKGLIGENAFQAMKPTALVVDVSRGGVIEGDALLRALNTGQIAGAGLDVFELEPLPEDSAFWDVENAIISPHSSSVYDGWAMDSFKLFLGNLERWQKGQPLRNVVSPTRGY